MVGGGTRIEAMSKFEDGTLNVNNLARGWCDVD